MSRSWELSDGGDIIDSRDIEARIDELESMECDLAEALEAATDDEAKEEALEALEEWREAEDGGEELRKLREFRDECGYADWNHGEALIADAHFEDYARELAEDIGSINREMEWPCTFIDWPAAAKALKMDYASAELDGAEYWFRA